jgi:enoyl-CoA hydratase/carnithine racemase
VESKDVAATVTGDPYSESPVLLTRENGIACVTLNRPKAGNSIDVPLARALMETAIECDEDDGIRCVLLTGAGRMFCAGGDVSGFGAAGDKIPALVKELTAYIHSAISRFSRMNKPMVVAVNGPAAGAGFGFALLGDIVLAAESSHFTMAYTAIGLSPDGGTTWLLPRLAGLRRAQEWAVTNKRILPQEALATGPSAAPATCCWKASAIRWKRSWSWKRAGSPPAAAIRKARRALPPFSPSANRISARLEVGYRLPEP